MAEIAYVAWNPSPKSLTLIGIANQICAEYAELFNQRVARQEKGRDQLVSLAENWDYVVQQLD